MCGLFGFTGKTCPDLYKFKIGLLDNQNRGEDATGVFGRHLYTSVLKAEKFITRPRFRYVTNAHNVIAHTRKASSGFNNLDNAHPFVVDTGDDGPDLIGCHNGTLIPEAERYLINKYGIQKPSVDSHSIYDVFVKTGYDYDSISDIDGSMALAFMLDGYLHLYRRESKPLYIGETKEGFYYSSREITLDMIGARCIFKIATDTFYVFRDGVLIDEFAINPPVVNNIREDGFVRNWEVGATDQAKEKYNIRSWNSNNSVHRRNDVYTNYYDDIDDDYVYPSRNLTTEHKPINVDIMKKENELNLNWLTDSIKKNDYRIKEITDESSYFSSRYVGEKKQGHILFCQVFAEHPDESYTPLSDWVAWVEDEGSPSITSMTGRVSVDVPKEKCGQKKRLFFANSKNEKNKIFYTKEIYLSSGTVSEVTVYIPFLEQEKEKKEGEDGIEKLPFYVDDKRDDEANTSSHVSMSVLGSEHDQSKHTQHSEKTLTDDDNLENEDYEDNSFIEEESWDEVVIEKAREIADGSSLMLNARIRQNMDLREITGDIIQSIYDLISAIEDCDDIEKHGMLFSNHLEKLRSVKLLIQSKIADELAEYEFINRI